MYPRPTTVRQRRDDGAPVTAAAAAAATPQAPSTSSTATHDETASHVVAATTTSSSDVPTDPAYKTLTSGPAQLYVRFDASNAASFLGTDMKTPVVVDNASTAVTPVAIWASSSDSSVSAFVGSYTSNAVVGIPDYYPFGVNPSGAGSAGGMIQLVNTGKNASTDGQPWYTWFVGPGGGGDILALVPYGADGFAFLAALRFPTDSTCASCPLWQSSDDTLRLYWDGTASSLFIQFITVGNTLASYPVPMDANLQRALPFGSDAGALIAPPVVLGFVWNKAGVYAYVNGTMVVEVDASTLISPYDAAPQPPTAPSTPTYNVGIINFAGGVYNEPSSNPMGLNGTFVWGGGAFHEFMFLSGAPSDTQLAAGMQYLANKWQPLGSGSGGCGCYGGNAPPNNSGGGSSSSGGGGGGGSSSDGGSVTPAPKTSLNNVIGISLIVLMGIIMLVVALVLLRKRHDDDDDDSEEEEDVANITNAGWAYPLRTNM